ncbi:MAG TPA: hypothetical protein DD435_02280 [Cyanobacteria bacterium UBA8530]|nr:hypothetical protein [Cyanobacteria bacterium UBA8530]
MIEKKNESQIVSVGFDPVAKEVVIKHGAGMPEVGIPAIGLVAKQYGELGIIVVELKIGGVEVSFVSAADQFPNKLVVIPGDPSKVHLALVPLTEAVHLLVEGEPEPRKDESADPSKGSEKP